MYTICVHCKQFYWLFRNPLLLTCGTSAKIKKLFKHMIGSITKLVRNCVTFRIQKNGAKKLIFFNLEVLALIFKIYLKIFNGRNYCYNRSRTLILFEYFKISSKKLTFSNLAVSREVSIAYFYFLNF